MSTVIKSRPATQVSRAKIIHPTVTPRVKLWLEANGESVFCRGLAGVLEAVDRTHSIKAAAEDFGRSYRLVWGPPGELNSA